MLPFRFLIEKIKVIEYTGYDLGEFELRGYNRGDGYTLNRGTLVTVMYEHARELGIDIRLNSPVTDYWETDYEGGVVVHGERFAADCVLCAEGVHSKGREKITGKQLVSWETGWSAFRGCLSTDAVAADPATRWALDNAEKYDQTVGWVSDDIHFALWRGRKGKELFWYCTHEVGIFFYPRPYRYGSILNTLRTSTLRKRDGMVVQMWLRTSLTPSRIGLCARSWSHSFGKGREVGMSIRSW